MCWAVAAVAAVTAPNQMTADARVVLRIYAQTDRVP